MEANKNNAKKLTWKAPVVYNLSESKNIEGKSQTFKYETTGTTKYSKVVSLAPS